MAADPGDRAEQAPVAADADGRWPVVFLMGPTACGKSELALRLADRLPVELISVDSALVYRGLDVGTAKPSAAERARHHHHLVDVRDPAEPFSAADFRGEAMVLLDRARAKWRLPVLVGGTMLYFHVLEHGLAEMPQADAALRRQLDRREREEGIRALHAELAGRDPAAAARIHPHNVQRVKRALEVLALSGRPISAWWAEGGGGEDFHSVYAPRRVALVPDDRRRLHAVIESRFDAMLAAGLVDEVRALRARGDLDPSLPALRAVGYRQVWEHLEGAYDAEEMRRRAVVATRRLARRQLTWLRRWPGLTWLPVTPGEPLSPSAATTVLELARAALHSGDPASIVDEDRG